MQTEDKFTIHRNSPLHQLFVETKLFIIDEASMMDKCYLETINSSLQDLFENKKLFGGIFIHIIIFRYY